ncbi:RagB/SusD family nutrient uptake outer membrane protein [Anditalea andensis]|uniref:Membrane protein n=1 Tax=Anditalea andensis TaxID=1048983 RepID=A0A074LP17_9BACT|nr:RagB/SusD family nutrient uptake outer membrane protein [Anditalea andensis]KEO75637.1 membrane protein [Anditalea andensis]
MKKYILIAATVIVTCTSCNDDEFLNRDPRNILIDNQVFNDPAIVLSVVADLYARYPEYQQINGNVHDHANFNEAFSSQDYGRHGNQDFGYGDWGWWNYGFVRELNLFLEKIAIANQLDEGVRSRFEAEVKWLRASVYFDAVKRVGGVPLILQTLEYDFSGDPSYLRVSRAKEHEIYDFILQEMDAILPALPANAEIKDRATKGLAIALKSRAALYAGSIAKHGVRTPEVSLPGGEVGIPASMANGYYTTSLEASLQLLSGEMGNYHLYMKNPDSLSANFASLFIDKNQNPEAIFVNDFRLRSGKINHWTLENQPRSMSEDGVNGGRVNPSLNFVQSFELLGNNSFSPFPIRDASGNFIVYDDQLDIFRGRDARLYATVMLPGSTYRGSNDKVDIWAGLFRPQNGEIISADQPGVVQTVDGTDKQVVGFDGPINGFNFTAQTGFLIRKYIDPTPGAGQIGTQSDVWYIRFRIGEIVLNAAEAAFELGDLGLAAQHLNEIRQRAGFTTDLSAGDITFDRIVHERRMELAFEGHELWDMKRWRIAHLILDGQNMDANSLVQNIGVATKRKTQVYGLWPYKIHSPGSPDHNKWIYNIVQPNRVTNSDRFRIGNYYSFINDEIRNRNPLIVINPNQ